MQSFKHPHLPHLPAIMLIGFQNFPFPGKPVPNFILQGVTVFLLAAIAGFALGSVCG